MCSVVTFHCERTVGRLFAFGISISVDSIDLLKSLFFFVKDFLVRSVSVLLRLQVVVKDIVGF